VVKNLDLPLACILTALLICPAVAGKGAETGWSPGVNAFLDTGGDLRMTDWDTGSLGDKSGFFMRAFGVFLESGRCRFIPGSPRR
jgi:hypothetical protein